MRKPPSKTTQAVTVRLSMADYADILHAAERLNISIADTMRQAWRHYKVREVQSNERDQQTQELKLFIFECLGVTKAWDSSQRSAALQRINSRLASNSEETK